MSAHTPRPWTHGAPADGGRINVYADERMAVRICRVDGGERCAADARLIAAAPDLLAALKALLPVAEAFERQASRGAGGRRGGAVFGRARAAIAKATGEKA